MALALLRHSPSGACVRACHSFHASMLSARHASTGGSLNSYLVTPQELSQALAKNAPTRISTSPRIVPLCAAWFLPNDPEGRTGRAAFAAQRIPQARFFDLDAVCDRDSPYPHMLPTAEAFADAMSRLGLRRDDALVVYDTRELGIFSAPRVAWTLRFFGHPGVHVLNNFRRWVAEGYPTESGEVVEELVGEGEVEKKKKTYPVPKIHNPAAVACFREMKSIAKDHGKEGADSVQIVDARSPGRFAGRDPEPRPEISSGHMPGAINIPLPEILDPSSKAILPGAELRTLFEAKGLDPTQPIYSTCGSGVIAAALETAFAEAGFGDEKDRKVYDGSWT